MRSAPCESHEPTTSREAPSDSATRIAVARVTLPPGTPIASCARRRSLPGTAGTPARWSARGRVSATAAPIQPAPAPRDLREGRRRPGRLRRRTLREAGRGGPRASRGQLDPGRGPRPGVRPEGPLHAEAQELVQAVRPLVAHGDGRAVAVASPCSRNARRAVLTSAAPSPRPCASGATETWQTCPFARARRLAINTPIGPHGPSASREASASNRPQPERTTRVSTNPRQVAGVE